MYTAENTPSHPLVAEAEQAFRARRVTDAFRLCKQLVREATADRDDFLLVYVLSNLSLLECVRGEAPEAFRNIFEAQRLAARLKVASISGKIEMRYIDLLRRFGSLRETSARVNTILRSGRQTPLDPFDGAILLTTLGLVYLDLRQFTYTEASFQQSLLLCQAKGVDVQVPSHVARTPHGQYRAGMVPGAARRDRRGYGPMEWAGKINDRLSLARGRADVALMNLLARDEESLIGSLDAQNGHLPGDPAAIARRDFFLCRAAAHQRVGLFRKALAAYKVSTSMRQALALQAMAPLAAPGFTSKPTSPMVGHGRSITDLPSCRRVHPLTIG